MSMVAATSFTGLLELFAVVPLGVMAAICAADCATAYRRRHGSRAPR